MKNNSVKNCSENYIFLGVVSHLVADADNIISKMKISNPEKFEGNRDYFSFEFRYTAPFDKDFHELKRLQGTASEVAGRRNEFKGYIVIDMSNWLTHHDEDYLNKALLFLIDMSDCWKYIFLVDNQNSKAAKELVGKILSVFFHDHIPCRVKEKIENESMKGRVAAICKAQGVMCSPQVKEFLYELLKQGFSENIVSALLSEMSWTIGKKINTEIFGDFITNQESGIRYMLTQKEHNRILTMIEKRKESECGEKEAV